MVRSILWHLDSVSGVSFSDEMTTINT